VGFTRLELASLVDRRIDASVSDEFIEDFKAVDITDFGQDSYASHRRCWEALGCWSSHSRNRSPRR
jgi:hypothetical protein